MRMKGRTAWQQENRCIHQQEENADKQAALPFAGNFGLGASTSETNYIPSVVHTRNAITGMFLSKFQR